MEEEKTGVGEVVSSAVGGEGEGGSAGSRFLPRRPENQEAACSRIIGTNGKCRGLQERYSMCVCVCVDVVRVPATFHPKLMGGEGLHLLRQPTTRGQSWTLL